MDTPKERVCYDEVELDLWRRNGIHVGMQEKAKEPGDRVSDEWEELKVEGRRSMGRFGHPRLLPPPEME